MKSKQTTLCEVECSCGETVNLWINGEIVGESYNCICGKSYSIGIVLTSIWTPTRIEYTILIEEED